MAGVPVAQTEETINAFFVLFTIKQRIIFRNIMSFLCYINYTFTHEHEEIGIHVYGSEE